MLRNRIFISLLALILVVFITLVVVGNVTVAHTNPEVTHTVSWNNPQTHDLAQRACYDCHSNETKWPWYSFVAPVASIVAKDVEEGRRKMNFSTGRELEGEEMVEEVEKGDMPPAKYLLLHPEANLSDSEKEMLIAGLTATFGD